MSTTAFSENEDDPEVYESSGDEWDSVEEQKPNRRSSRRLSKRPRKSIVESESSEDLSDEELSEEEPKKRKTKNGTAKKRTPQKSSKKEKDEDSSDSKDSTKEKSNSDSKTTAFVPVARGIHRKFIPKTIHSDDYATGSFVILKKDAQSGDPSKHPSIWRIDGKALLQKYEAFDEENKVRHKNTSIYTGWSPMDKDLYAPVTVDVVHHNNQNLTVELHWDKLKEINIDSD